MKGYVAVLDTTSPGINDYIRLARLNQALADLAAEAERLEGVIGARRQP